MSQGSVLKVRLSLKGRPIRTYTFAKKQVTIGRDPESDIFLDNAGVSRNHARFELTPGGYVLEDLGSANGTFLNDEQVAKKSIADDDIIRVGKFALWVNLGDDQRTRSGEGKKANPTADQGTVVLSNDQIDKMLTSIRNEAAKPAEDPRGAWEGDDVSTPTSAAQANSRTPLLAAASFLAGVAVGACIVWVLLSSNPTFLSLAH